MGRGGAFPERSHDAPGLGSVLVQHAPAKLHGGLCRMPWNAESPSSATAFKFAKKKVATVREQRRVCSEYNFCFVVSHNKHSPNPQVERTLWRLNRRLAVMPNALNCGHCV